MLIIPALWLICLGVVLSRRPAAEVGGASTFGGDASTRLLRWAVGLLAPERGEWGEAMVAELAYIEGRRRRWRFAVGCATSMLLPPWGRHTPAIIATFVVAAASAAVAISTIARYGWALSSQETIAVILLILVGFCAAAIVLLCRPGVALPGLLGGLVMVVAWLADLGYTPSDIVEGKSSSFFHLMLMLFVPGVIGMGATAWSGSLAIGKRAARLAAVSAGLTTFLYGCIAVVAIGSGGQGDPGSTLAATITDRISNQGIEFLLMLPTLTAVIGWAGAASMSRLHLRASVQTDLRQEPAGSDVTQPTRRTLVLGAVIGGALLLASATFLAG